jgi:hypothetical protein
MKIQVKYLVLLLATIGFLSPAFAQRGDHRGGGGGGNQGRSSNSSNSGRPTYSAPSRQSNSSFGNRQYNQSCLTVRTQNNNNNRVTSTNRGGYTTPSSNFGGRNRSGYVAQNNSFRGSRTVRNTSTTRYGYNNYGSRGSYHPYYHNNYVPRRYVYSGYSHYRILPRTSISIYFGGYPYYYNAGYYYSYYDGFYEPVFAPFGMRIGMLPFGYYSFYWGGIPYYYYEGTYYRSYGDSEYEVVDAPMGAIVTTLPKGATAVMVNGEKFYEFNGTYYKESVDSKNRVQYTVVGKNGEVNNSTPEPESNNLPAATDQQPSVQTSSDQPAPTQQPSARASVKVGDVITSLPANSRPVTIDGQALYVSPDNVYYKAKKADDGSTAYEVVGADIQNQ